MTLVQARQVVDKKARVFQGGIVLEAQNGANTVVFKLFRPDSPAFLMQRPAEGARPVA